MTALSLFSTSSRTVERFAPLGDTVSLYCCGPTVYHYAHIGNLRTYVSEDVLRRTLESSGYNVRHVMNITDVGHLTSDADTGEDKMAKGARREGKSVWEIARFYEEAFFRDADSLGILRPHVVCRATEHVNDMIALVERLKTNGYTYSSGGNVYFDIARFPRYPELARLSLEQMRSGARVDVDEAKRDPLDFALWFTKSKFGNQDMQWDSPWGRGFPGWHLECSAMSMKYLGEQIDIHCGGTDHIPIHHTNEIAQSEAATGKHPWVNYWVHNEFMVFNKEKISKSSGDFLTIDSVRERGIDPLAFRLFCFSAHYRSPLTFSWEGIEASAQNLAKLKALVPALDSTQVETATVERVLEPFREALNTDINMPRALAAVWNVLRDGAVSGPLKRRCAQEFDTVLGLGLLADVAGVEVSVDGYLVRFSGAIPAGVDLNVLAKMVAGRAVARKTRDFAVADRLRNELAGAGVSVKDLADGGAECVIKA